MSDKLLSELIKKARESSDLTQTAFGKFFDPSVAQSTVAKWEKGDLSPKRKHFPKIASLLNITLEEFFDLVGEQLINEGIIHSISENAIYVPNKRHFSILNRGVKSWNRWRERNYRVIPQLAGAKPQEDYLDEIDFNHADLKGSILQRKSLRASNLRGTDLSNANLSNANLSDADLRGANLSDADLRGANLSDADLRGADLSEANLSDVNLSDADLRRVNLSEAILVDAVLCGANFLGANLSNADLTHADMRGANLNEANLEYAILKYCFVYGISDWNTNLNKAVQNKLSICPHKTHSMYVDCLENARLKLLEIDNREIPEIHQSAINLQTAISKNRVSFKEKLKNFKVQKDLKVKSKIDRVPGEVNIEHTDNCKILRCIYHFQALLCDTYCLIRIYEFKSKTIVIASQLVGAILWDSLLIENVIDDLNLNHENLYWINHYGLFSNVAIEEKFLHTTFSYKKDFIFSSKRISLEQEIEVSIKFVEDLIESSLEPVELWLGLDTVAGNRLIQAREEKTFELLYHYLKDNIKYLHKQKEIREILVKSRTGAIFFYPNQSEKIELVGYTELLNCSDNLQKKALAYINKIFPDEEIVICVCIDNHEPLCTILRKEFLVNPVRINFPSIEKLAEYEIELSDIVELDIDEYRHKVRVGKERLESLLQLYLEPKFERLKSIFEQMESARSHLETQRGALFYYPEHDQCVFSTKHQLTSAFEKPAIPYVDKYDVETEMVICFSIYNKLSVCGIFPKF